MEDIAKERLNKVVEKALDPLTRDEQLNHSSDSDSEAASGSSSKSASRSSDSSSGEETTDNAAGKPTEDTPEIPENTDEQGQESESQVQEEDKTG